MTLNEADRLAIMKKIDSRLITIKEASDEMRVCLRQAKRIRKRYLENGIKGLLSGHKGKKSGNRLSEEVKSKALILIHKHYADFGPTLASEKLKEKHEIAISVETIRKWMIEEGLRSAKKTKIFKIHQRRTRRSRFGELLQGDGSPHAWLEDRGPKCCFMHFIDDATNETTCGIFAPTESEEGYLELLKQHLKQYGKPLGLYVDKHSIFRVNRENLKDGKGVTHFGQVLQKLDIELICAHSPQAKGRIERNNGILQDRLIKEMRLEGICSIEEANKFLPKFLKSYNDRFRKEPANLEDAHRKMRKSDDLERIFAKEESRSLSKDLTFQLHHVLYMIETKTPNRLRYARVQVLHKNGHVIEITHEKKILKYKRWEEKVDMRSEVLDAKQLETRSVIGSKKHRKPGKHHPWR